MTITPHDARRLALDALHRAEAGRQGAPEESVYDRVERLEKEARSLYRWISFLVLIIVALGLTLFGLLEEPTIEREEQEQPRSEQCQ